MTTAISKAVLGELLDQSSRTMYAKDIVRRVGQDVLKGDSVELPKQASPTNASATTRAAPQSLTPTVATLSVDQDVFYNIVLPAMTTSQLMDGSWASETATDALEDAGNEMDDSLLSHMLRYGAYSATATFHGNVAADALTDNDVDLLVAKALDTDGVNYSNLVWILNPYGEGAIKQIAGWSGATEQTVMGSLGIKRVGTVAGIPAFVSRGVPRQRTVASTASAIATNVLTCTVAAGHGIVAGQKITTAGGTADVDTAAAVTSVTATTVVVPLTTADDATNGALTITVQSTENLLMDRRACFFAEQQMPSVEIVKDYESAARALQVFAAFGHQVHNGRVWCLNSPPTNVA